MAKKRHIPPVLLITLDKQSRAKLSFLAISAQLATSGDFVVDVRRR